MRIRETLDEQAQDMAVAIEYFHNASLLVDGGCSERLAVFWGLSDQYLDELKEVGRRLRPLVRE